MNRSLIPTLALAVAAALTLGQAAVAQTQTQAPASAPAASAPEVQSTAPATIEATGPTPTLGLRPEQIATWLATQGLTTGPVEMDGTNPYLRVTQGPLTWILLFQSCAEGLCADLQFSIGVQSSVITPELVNTWNRDRRFLKAFYDPEPLANGDRVAIVQYDLFLRPGAGPEQLTDSLSVWRALAPEFVRLTTRSGAASAAAPSSEVVPAPAPEGSTPNPPASR